VAYDRRVGARVVDFGTSGRLYQSALVTYDRQTESLWSHFTGLDVAGDGFRDRETGSTWDVLGRATAEPLAGRSLEPVEHVDTFWFAWAAFRPDTTIVP
jgi:hypothetical protein